MNEAMPRALPTGAVCAVFAVGVGMPGALGLSTVGIAFARLFRRQS